MNTSSVRPPAADGSMRRLPATPLNMEYPVPPAAISTASFHRRRSLRATNGFPRRADRTIEYNSHSPASTNSGPVTCQITQIIRSLGLGSSKVKRAVIGLPIETGAWLVA